jgi:hypothetical protein
MYSFIAVTVHYIVKDENEVYRLRHHLIGFEYLPGSHSGEQIAQSLYAVYTSLGITHRVSSNLVYFLLLDMSCSSGQSLWTMHHQIVLR